MEKTQDINSILSKLKKLQRLYEGAKAINSEAEAQNAAAKIQNLLTQYNLSMVDLEAAVDDEPKTNVTEEKLDDSWQRKCGGFWDQLLLYGICKYNFCYTIVSSQYTHRINRNLQAQVQVNALVLRHDQQLNDYVAENYKDLRASKPGHIGSYQAMQQGREDGRKVNITRGGIAASNTNPNRIAQ